MNKRDLIHQAIVLGEQINSEPRFTIEKVNWIVEKAKIECQIGIHNL